MTKNKLVSVLFPVYNTERYVRESLYSLLNQTYKNIEVIAINDGSTDGSLSILKEIAAKDDRVKVVNQHNHGLVKTLNYGASIAEGEYIARMDSDDLSLPQRFEEQVKVLDSSPAVVLVAGTFEVIDSDSEFLYRETLPAKDEDIKYAMYVRNPIAHGSVMFRKEAFKKAGGYSEDCGPTEDYELWSRMALLGEFVGLENTIFRWRVNPSGITSTKSKQVEKYMLKNLDAYWQSRPPKITKRSEIIKNGFDYLSSYKKHGVAMKVSMTSDRAQLAMKLLRKRHLGSGLCLLWNVMTSGRAGFFTSISRARLIAANLIKHRGFEKPSVTPLQ